MKEFCRWIRTKVIELDEVQIPDRSIGEEIIRSRSSISNIPSGDRCRLSRLIQKNRDGSRRSK